MNSSLYAQSFKYGQPDTVLMIGSVGGYDILLEKDFFLNYDKFSLNKNISITSYNYALLGEDKNHLINSNQIDNYLKDKIKETNNYIIFYIENIECADINNIKIKLSGSFKIRIENL